MKIPIMKNPETKELSFELPDSYPQQSMTLAEETKAKLAEETNTQLMAEIGGLKGEIIRLKSELEAKLAEEPAELSDQERFDELVDDIKSLSKDGKARLAEATSWTYNAPVIEEAPPEAPKAKPRWRIVVKS